MLVVYQPMALLLLAWVVVLMDMRHFVGLKRLAWLVWAMVIVIAMLVVYQPMALLLLALVMVLMEMRHFVGLNRVA